MHGCFASRGVSTQMLACQNSTWRPHTILIRDIAGPSNLVSLPPSRTAPVPGRSGVNTPAAWYVVRLDIGTLPRPGTAALREQYSDSPYFYCWLFQRRRKRMGRSVNSVSHTPYIRSYSTRTGLIGFLCLNHTRRKRIARDIQCSICWTRNGIFIWSVRSCNS